MRIGISPEYNQSKEQITTFTNKERDEWPDLCGGRIVAEEYSALLLTALGDGGLLPVLHDVGEREPQVLVHRLQLNTEGKECQKTIPSSRISNRTISSRELSGVSQRDAVYLFG